MAVFYDAGKVAPRFDDLSFKGLAHDWGVGVRFHGPGVHSAAARGRARVGRRQLRVLRERGFLAMRPRPSTPARARWRSWPRAPRSLAVAGVRAASRRLAEVLSRRSAVARARNRRRRARQPATDRSAAGSDVEPLHPAGRSREERPRARHQHDRRSARLELVHEPDLRAAADGRRRRARAEHGCGTGAWALDGDRRQGRGLRPGLHDARQPRRDVVRRVRSEGIPARLHRRRRGRSTTLLGARLQPGRVVHHDAQAIRSGHRPEGHDLTTSLEKAGAAGVRSRAGL